MASHSPTSKTSTKGRTYTSHVPRESRTNLKVTVTYQPERISPYLETKRTTNKGIGVFATHSLTAGTLILTTPPILILPRILTPAALETAYQALPAATKVAFDLLYENPSSPHPTARLRKYRTNVFSYEGGAGESCIYLPTSRINHSCIPNVTMSWNPHTKQHELLATVAIRKGEEITITYGGTLAFLPASIRQQYLQEAYGFHCTCKACTSGTPFQKISDMRRYLAMGIQHSLNGTTRAAKLGFDVSKNFEALGIRILRKRRQFTLVEEAWWAFVLAKLFEAEGLAGVTLINPYVHAIICLADYIEVAKKSVGRGFGGTAREEEWVAEWKVVLAKNMRLVYSEGNPLRLGFQDQGRHDGLKDSESR